MGSAGYINVVGRGVAVGVAAGPGVGVGVGDGDGVGVTVGVEVGVALGRGASASAEAAVGVAARRGVGVGLSVTAEVAAGRGEAGAAVTGVGVAVAGAGVGVAVASTGFASFRSDNAGGIQLSGITPKEKAAIPAAAPSARMRSIPMNFAILRSLRLPGLERGFYQNTPSSPLSGEPCITHRPSDDLCITPCRPDRVAATLLAALAP